MAAAPWGNTANQNWAEEVEQEEKANGGVLASREEFPTLGAVAKQKPAKKGKGQKLSLSDFMGNSSVGPRSSALSDSQIRASLPTAPRGRDGDDDSAGLGGAFKEYDSQRGRGGFGRYGDDEGGRRGRDEDMMPSRADSADDWGKERKFTPTDGGGGSRGFGGGGFGGGGFGARREGGGGFQDRERPGGFERRGFEDGPSRADAEDSWGRRSQPMDDGRGQGFDSRDRMGGGGFGDRERAPGGFRERPRFDEPSRADDGDWSSRRPLSPATSDGSGPKSSKGYGFSGDRGDTDKWARPPSGAGDAPPASQPTERKRLVLQPRTVPVGETAQPSTSGQPRKNDPFGAARPREEVLKEKGLDPVKEELKLEHHSELREETEEEQAHKKEIEDMRLKLEVLKEADGESEETQEMQKQLDEKELALLKLQAELDDKVKYAKKAAAANGETSPAKPDTEFKPRDSRGPRGGRGGPPPENGSRW